MRQVVKDLNTVIEASQFDLGRVEQSTVGSTILYSQKSEDVVSPTSLKELAVRQSCEDDRVARARRARVIVPEDAFAAWSSTVEKWLIDYVDPKTKTIGHAFHTRSMYRTFSKAESNGATGEFGVSFLDDFARILVRGAAILGTEALVRMLCNWLEEEEIRYQTLAVLNEPTLTDTLAPLPGIRIEPLPRATDGKFSSLPVPAGYSIVNLLGKSVLSLESVVQPAFFRPQEEGNSSLVQAQLTTDLDLEQVCMALSLESDKAVTWAFAWNDYAEASMYIIPEKVGPRNTTCGHLRSLRQGDCLTIDIETGQSSVMIDNQNVWHVSQDRLKRILLAMKKHNELSIEVAISRWYKSKKRDGLPVDPFIDLRIALEALFLKNFDTKNRGELKFRLALYGAWYLGENYEERKNIKKTLADAYVEASKAIHGDQPKRSEQWLELLTRAQSLCREGILKFLEQGFKSGWDQIVLGANHTESNDRPPV